MDLRPVLDRSKPLVLPGVADALTAAIAADVGFEAVYVTGAGVTNRYLGMPDLGLVTLPELADHVETIRDAVNVAIVVDADTGFGGPLNVQRTVRLLERRGADAIQLEDQVLPKRCGHFSGKEVIPVAEMVAKIRAAVDARQADSTMIIARTDARQTDGINEAIDRANAYRQAGADITFTEAPGSADEIRAIAEHVEGPKLINLVEGGDTPILSLAELAEYGYDVVLYANSALRAAIRATAAMLAHLKQHGSTDGALDQMVSWSERQRLVGKDRFDELERKYAT